MEEEGAGLSIIFWQGFFLVFYWCCRDVVLIPSAQLQSREQGSKFLRCFKSCFCTWRLTVYWVKYATIQFRENSYSDIIFAVTVRTFSNAWPFHWSNIWDKVFKNGPSEIQPLKNLKWYGLPKQTISLKIFQRLSSTNFNWSIFE